MVQRASPFRLLVTLLLAVAVPFCCCNFHSWLSACGPCEAAEHSDDGDLALTGDHVKQTSDHQDADAPLSHHEDHNAPCGPSKDKDGPCSCGKSNAPMLTVEKSGMDLPMPVLLAVLPHSFVSPLVQSVCSDVRRDSTSLARPPTSLLRLHCALTV